MRKFVHYIVSPKLQHVVYFSTIYFVFYFVFSIIVCDLPRTNNFLIVHGWTLNKFIFGNNSQQVIIIVVKKYTLSNIDDRGDRKLRFILPIVIDEWLLK